MTNDLKKPINTVYLYKVYLLAYTITIISSLLVMYLGGFLEPILHPPETNITCISTITKEEVTCPTRGVYPLSNTSTFYSNFSFIINISEEDIND